MTASPFPPPGHLRVAYSIGEPMSKPSLIADLLERLDAERRYEFDELAGILEVENGVDRDTAEILALIDLLRAHPAALLGVTTFEVVHGSSRSFVLTTNAESTGDIFGANVLRIVDLAEVLRDQFDGLAVMEPLKQ
jgi:hypothetical protein